MTVLASIVAAGGAQLAVASAPHAAATALASAVIIRPLTVQPITELSFGRLSYDAGPKSPAVATVVIAAAPTAASTGARASADAQLLPNGGETPAIRTLAGDPRYAYRVTVSPTASSPGGLTVGAFTIWSANSGDITLRPGALNAAGGDTLRIGATLNVPRGTKPGVYMAMPVINVAYE